MMRELVIEVASRMPENASIEEILDAIIVKLGIEKGLEDIEKGNVITQEELLKEIKTW